MHVDNSQNGFGSTISFLMNESRIYNSFINAHVLEICDDLFEIQIT